MKFKLLILLFCNTIWASEQRIIPLAPSINEILFALGEGNRIVGNTTYATYPKESQNITKVGGYFSVSLEKILKLKPTLVLMQKNNLSLKPKLEKLGIKTEFVKISSLEDIKRGILKIGKLVSREDKAKKITNRIDKEVDSTKGILKDKKVLIAFGRQFDLKKEVFVSGNSIYFADIIKASGNKNAFDEQTNKQPMLSYEGIIKSNPDIIYILAHTIKNKDETKELIKPWLKLPISAAKAKTIYVTTKKYAGIPSQRVVNFIEDFKEILTDAKSKLSNIQNR